MLCVNVHELNHTCTCSVSWPTIGWCNLCFCFFFLTLSPSLSLRLTTALFFIGVLSAMPLLSVLRPLPPFLFLSFARSPSPCSDNLIKGPSAHGPRSFFHHAAPLSGERYSFTGFLWLPAFLRLPLAPPHSPSVLSHCSPLLPLICPSPPSFHSLIHHISPSFSGGLPLRSHCTSFCPLPLLFSCYMSQSLFSTLTAGTKAHSNQISSNHDPIGH